MISYRDTLHHSGIPGMHWGIRRYQNKDGTLTEAGKERYRKNRDRSAKESEPKQNNSVKEQKKKQMAELKSRYKKLGEETKDLLTFQYGADELKPYTPEKRTRVTQAADLGLKALAQDNFWDVSMDDVGNNDMRSWFLWEDQTIGLGMVSDMINRGYTSKDVAKLAADVKSADELASSIARDADEWPYPKDRHLDSVMFAVNENLYQDQLVTFAQRCEKVKKQESIHHSTLYHDGKPGMHWGVRKYRNYDGTLTEAGRKRYGVGPAREKSKGGRKLSRAERKAAKEIQKKASAKAAERKAREMRDEARKALEELKKEREELDRARADREQNSATAEGNAQMKLNNELLKMRVEQLKTQREYDSLLHPTKQKVPLSKRLGDLADNSRKLVAFGKDVAELSAAIKKAKNGDTKSALDVLKDQETIDKLKFAMESRAKTRAEWDAKAEAAKAAAAEAGKQSRQDANTGHKDSEGVNSRDNKDENANGPVNYPNYHPPRQERSSSESTSGSRPSSRQTAWEAPASRPDYRMPALPPHEEPKSRKKKRKG